MSVLIKSITYETARLYQFTGEQLSTALETAYHRPEYLSAAAQHLNIAQPSLSRSMKKLEEMLGVTLFERHKNRIVLNATGNLAAEHARHILDAEKEMERSVRAFDRSIHTISVGSCCPGPLMDLLPKITGLFHGMSVSSEIGTQEQLLKSLRNFDYTFIILPNPVESEGLFCKKYRTEQLFLSPRFIQQLLVKKYLLLN